MIRVYLDTSVFNRLFDDQTQPKIFLETQATILILQMIESGLVELVSSSVLEYENSRNPFPIKQQTMARYLQIASIRRNVDIAIQQRSELLGQDGLKAIDALHVASAEGTNSDYFITCDKRLINRYKSDLVKVVNPVDFILEETSDDSSN
jgi:predicted nucleic acid-binding protein